MTFTAAHLKRFKPALAYGVVALLFGLGTGQALATDINISNKPLDTLEGVPANILLTMDDSGSMEWNYMPDSLDDNPAIDNTRRAKSSTVNKIYYNPAITYEPAKDKNGASLGNATFTAAWYNGFVHGDGTRDLSTNYCALWDDVGDCARNSPTSTDSGVAAFYYVFDTGNTNTGGTSCTVVADSNDDACYTRVDIVSTTTSYQGLFDATRTNSSGGTCDHATDTGDSLCYTTSGRIAKLCQLVFLLPGTSSAGQDGRYPCFFQPEHQHSGELATTQYQHRHRG